MIHSLPSGGLRTNLPSQNSMVMVQEDGECRLSFSGRGDHLMLDYQGTPVMGGAPPRYVAGNAFFNYQLYGGLRKGGSINFFSTEYRGYAIAAFLSGYVYAVVMYLLMRLPDEVLNLERGTYLKNVLSLQWTVVLVVGILSDAYAPFGLRRKSYIIFGWILSALLWLTLFILFLATATPPPSATVPLIVLAFLSLIVATSAMDIRIIELSQQEELQLRGRLLGSYQILRIGAQFIAHSLIVAIVRPDPTFVSIVRLPFDVKYVFLHLAVVSAVPLYGLFKHADEPRKASTTRTQSRLPQPTPNSDIDQLQSHQTITSTGTPATSTTSSSSSSFHHVKQRLTELWNCAQQRVVWQLVVFNCVLFFFGMFELIDVRRAVQVLGGESSMVRTIRNCIGDAAFVATLVLWRRYGINASWRVLTAGTVLFVMAVWFTASTLVIYDVVRASWLHTLSWTLRAPHRVLVLLATFVPCIEIAPAGTEGTTYALLACSQTIVKMVAAELAQVITSAWPAIDVNMKELQRNGTTKETENALFYGVLVMCLWMLGALLGLFFLPQQKLDAQQLRVYGGYSKLPVLLLCLGFLAGLPYVSYLQISRVGT